MNAFRKLFVCAVIILTAIVVTWFVISDRTESSRQVSPPKLLEARHSGRTSSEPALSTQAETLNSQRGCTVQGTVYFAENGKPVAEVDVLAVRPDKGVVAQSTTDSDGHYSIVGLSSYKVNFLVVEDTERDLVSVEPRRLALGKHDALSSVDILIAPGASLSGMALYRHTNAPVAGIKMVIVAFEDLSPLLIPKETETAEDGRFHIGLLPAGKYFLAVTPTPGRVSARAQDAKAQHFPIELERGERKENFSIYFDEPVRMTGRVTVSGSPVEEAELTAIPWGRSGVAVRQTKTAKDGSYSVTELTPDTEYRVSVLARGCSNDTRQVKVAKSDVSGVDFHLEHEAVISGTVVDEDGNLISNGTLFLVRSVNANDAVEQEYTPPSGPPANISADGSFTASKLAAGVYTLQVVEGSPSTSGALPSSTPPVEVVQGQRVEGVRVVVARAKSQFIEGHVSNLEHAPLEGVFVGAALGDQPFLAKSQTDASGFYRLERLGSKRVNLSFRAGPNQIIELADVPIGSTNADIVLADPGSVVVSVVDSETGEPVPGAMVKITVMPLGSTAATTERDNETGPDLNLPGPKPEPGQQPGVFAFRDVPPGTVTFRATAEGYVPGELTGITVNSGATTAEIILHLWRAGSIEGKISWSTGEPSVVDGIVALPLDPKGNPISLILREDGTFSYSELTPGRYLVTITIRSPLGQEALEQEVVVRSGQVTTADFLF